MKKETTGTARPLSLDEFLMLTSHVGLLPAEALAGVTSRDCHRQLLTRLLSRLKPPKKAPGGLTDDDAARILQDMSRRAAEIKTA